VSSILEALRELEGTKPSSRRSRVAWAAGAEEERAPLRRAAEVLGIVAFGLALGVAGFGLFVWLGVPGEVEPEAQAPFAAAVPARVDAPTAAPAPQTLAPAAPAPSVPAWLARMGPPRGRVDGGDDDARAEPAAEAAVAPRGAGLSLVRVRYGESRSERTATLRIDGNPLVLHEGESAEGIELQLVTPNGAYVRRGGEVLMLAPSR
jgi:hypothetical protein